MEINRHTYQAFLLDLSEGRLSEEEARLLRDFLRDHPDCPAHEPDPRGWQDHVPEQRFPGKESLKREFPDPRTRLTEANVDLFSIARLEGDLTPEQADAHEERVNRDPESREEWNRWKKTRLVPPVVEYPGKPGLKRRSTSSFRWIIPGAAAAAVVALFLLASPWKIRTDTGPPGGVLAEVPGEGTVPDRVIPVPDPPRVQPAPPGLLSIGKRPDPPELTGKDIRAVEGDPVDTLRISEPRPARIEPARMAFFSPEKASYDRIRTLEVPPLTAGSSTQSFDPLSGSGLRQAYREFLDERQVSVWSVAGAGIRGINRLTGTELELDVNRDRSGQVSSVHFRSQRLRVDAPLKERQKTD